MKYVRKSNDLFKEIFSRLEHHKRTQDGYSKYRAEELEWMLKILEKRFKRKRFK